MKEIWKKSGLFYKIIAIMLTIVMVGTSLYFHFDRKYSAKATEGDVVITKAYLPNGDNGTIIGDGGWQEITDGTVGNDGNRQFAYLVKIKNDVVFDENPKYYLSSQPSEKNDINAAEGFTDDEYNVYIILINASTYNSADPYKICYRIQGKTDVDDSLEAFAFTDLDKITITSAKFVKDGVKTDFDGGAIVAKSGDTIEIELTVPYNFGLPDLEVLGNNFGNGSIGEPDDQTLLCTCNYEYEFSGDENILYTNKKIVAEEDTFTGDMVEANSVLYDQTKPNVTVTVDGKAYVANKWYDNSSVTFAVVSGDEEAGKESVINSITLNNADVSLTGGSYTKNFEDGENEIRVDATDAAGNSKTFNYAFGIDTTAPSIDSLLVQGESADNSFVGLNDGGDVRISGSIVEQGSGIDYVKVKLYDKNNTFLGGQDYQANTNGDYWANLSLLLGNVDLSSGDYDGKYTVEVTAYDMVEHTDTESITFTLDSKKPVVEKPDDVAFIRVKDHTTDDYVEVTSDDIDSTTNTYYLNKTKYDTIKLSVKVTEDNIDNDGVQGYIGDNPLARKFTDVNNDGVYEYELSDADLALITTADPVAIKIVVTDKAGASNDNQTFTPSLQELNGELRVELLDIKVNGTTVPVADLEEIIDSAGTLSKFLKTPITLTVRAVSVNEIAELKLSGEHYNNEGTLESFNKDGVISGVYVQSRGLYSSGEVDFTLPLAEFTGINNEFKDLSVYVEDSEGRHDTISIGDLMCDRTQPFVENDNAASFNAGKWYTDYQLHYKISSGESEVVESDLKSSTLKYTMSGNEVNIPSDALADDKKSASGTIDVDESTSTAGTVISFAASDKATNAIDPMRKTITVKVDKTNPTVDAVTVNGSTATAATTLSGNPTIQTTVNDNLTIKDYTIDVEYNDAEDYMSFTKPVNADETERAVNYSLNQILSQKNKELKDGKYTVSIKATDMSGRTSDVSSTTFTVDNTAPEFTASIVGGTSRKNNSYYNTDVRVKFTCKDNNFDASRVQITDNGSPVSATWNVEGDAYVAYVTISSATGHTVAVNGNDKAGTSGTSKSVYFVIDKTAPTVQLLVNGGMVYNESMGTLNLTQAASLNVSVTDSNEDSSDLRVQVVKTVPDTATVSSDYVSTSERSFTFGDEADYIIRIYAVDKANNNSSTREISFRVDRTAPELSITGANGGTSSSATTVTFTMNEAFYSDAKATVNIYRQASDRTSESLYKTLTLNGSSRSSSLSEAITETGIYRFEFEGSDRVGHSANTSQTLTVDVNKPVITLTGVNNYDVTDGEVNISASITDEFFTKKTVTATGTRIDAEGNKNAVVFNPYQSGADPTSISQSFKEDGIYDITISSKDIAGNESVNSVHFTIDTSDPVIGDLSKYDGKTFNSIDLDIDLDELVSDLTVCDVRMYLNGSEYDGISDIEDGSYTLLITAEDELGHTSEKSVTFILDTKAPIFIVTGVEDGEIRNDKYNIEISLQLDEDILDEVTLNGKAALLNDDNTATLNINDKGEYELYMKAHDEAGNVSEQTITFTFGEESVATAVSNAVQEAASHWWMWAILIAAIFATGGIIFFVLKRRKEE